MEAGSASISRSTRASQPCAVPRYHGSGGRAPWGSAAQGVGRRSGRSAAAAANRQSRRGVERRVGCPTPPALPPSPWRAHLAQLRLQLDGVQVGLVAGEVVQVALEVAAGRWGWWGGGSLAGRQAGRQAGRPGQARQVGWQAGRQAGGQAGQQQRVRQQRARQQRGQARSGGVGSVEASARWWREEEGVRRLGGAREPAAPTGTRPNALPHTPPTAAPRWPAPPPPPYTPRRSGPRCWSRCAPAPWPARTASRRPGRSGTAPGCSCGGGAGQGATWGNEGSPAAAR